MNTNEILFRLDAFGLAAAGWMATWLLHGAVLGALALTIGRTLRSGIFREQLCKVALLGAFVTTATQAFGSGLGEPFRFELESADPAGHPIAIVGAVPGTSLPELRAPGLAPDPTPAVAPATRQPVARWRWAHALPIAMLLVALAGGARLLRERRRLARILAGRRTVEDSDWNADLFELAGRAGLERAPRLTSSAALGSPIALARGELVVPARALRELDRGARRALLAHELAHLARRDPQWLAATAFLGHVLPLQPLLRPVRRRLIDEMELACDAQAVRWTGSGLPLARCLETVASWIAPGRAPVLVASMATRPSALVRRVESALAPAAAPVSPLRRRLFGFGVASLLALLACGGPQVAPSGAESVGEDEVTIDARLAPPGTPTLDFASDGQILAGGKVIYDPDVDSFTALDEHLAELAAEMDTRPMDPLSPDGLQLAMGELVLHAAPGAPARSLLKAMEVCGKVGIWRLRLTGDWPGENVSIAVPLPVDLGTEILAAVEEKDLADGSAKNIDSQVVKHVAVRLTVIVEGRKLDPRTRDPWDGTGRFVYDDSRVVGFDVGEKHTRDLAVLRRLLEDLREEWPDAHALIDARRGTVYADVVTVLDVIMAAGFDSITFVGSYE